MKNVVLRFRQTQHSANVCGNKINSADAVETELQQERICPVCHEKVDKGNFYCKHCGAKVDTTI